MKRSFLGVALVCAVVAPLATAARLTGHSESVDVGPVEYVPATAECGSGQRVVSGGFEAPGFNPADARVTIQSSAKRGRNRWSSAGLNFSPTFSGTLVGYAYCQEAGPRLRVRRAPTPTLDLEVVTAHCRAGERLVSGGFTIPDREDTAVLISRSHKKGQGWEVAGRVVSGSEVTLVAQAYCNADAPRLKTVKQTAPVTAGASRSLTEPCPRGRPLVSGGFTVSEPPTAATIFRSKRAGRQRWRVSAFNQGVDQGSVSVEVYCGRP